MLVLGIVTQISILLLRFHLMQYNSKCNCIFSSWLCCFQDLAYADITTFHRRDGGTVQLGVQPDASEYAQIRENDRPPDASSPPTYDDHLQRKKNQAPQPPSNISQLYAEIKKNWPHWKWRVIWRPQASDMWSWNTPLSVFIEDSFWTVFTMSMHFSGG